MLSAQEYKSKIWKALSAVVISFKIGGLINFCSEQVVCTLSNDFNTDNINICLTASGKNVFLINKENPRCFGNHLLTVYDVNFFSIFGFSTFQKCL